jgi:hypothetical protein
VSITWITPLGAKTSAVTTLASSSMMTPSLPASFGFRPLMVLAEEVFISLFLVLSAFCCTLTRLLN